ncbi:MAG: rhomboid family intramembrane serine protease [Pseudomonadales bacterium]|nr:rhomboid family intramembrane serine protease [Pseudomonadales bacterium]
MITALEVPSDKDLGLFTRYLTQLGIAHRIHEEGVSQVVLVANEADRERVRSVYEQIERGELQLEAVDPMGPKRPGEGVLSYVMRYPLTLALVLINVACYPASFGVGEGELSDWFHAMTFVEFEIRGDGVYFATLAWTLETGEYWRMLTPMFIHFSILHIVFNLLWVWEVGRRIEYVCGAMTLALIVLLGSLSSNFTQYVMSGPSLFGGMSGVVFGLLGYSFVWSRLVPQRSMGLPPGIYIFMFVFLVIGFTGAIDLLGLGALANGAHLGGLLAGLALGAIHALGTGHPRS